MPNTYSRGPFWLNFGHLIPHIYVPINIIIRRCCAIIFNEIPPCFVLIVFCGYYTLSNGPNYLHNTNIWGHFGQMGYLTPIGPYFELQNNTKNGLFYRPNIRKGGIT